MNISAFLRVFRRLPFTLFMLAVLLLVGWLTDTHAGADLSAHWLNRLGYAPRDLWRLNWGRFLSSPLVTSGGWVFWLALVMVALTSGAAEWLTSTRRAALTFWGVHIATLLIESLGLSLLLKRFGLAQAAALFIARDVGPSAGYFGSLGLALTCLPKPWRWLAGGAVLLFLVVSLFLPPRPGETEAVKLAADIAHLIAFPLGWLTASLGKRARQVDA
jgi:hypothetical protein